MTEHADPEGEQLFWIFRDDRLVDKLSAAPGGWRTLSENELASLDLTPNEVRAVRGLQELTSRAYPKLKPLVLACPKDVGEVYGHRLGGCLVERMTAIALDGLTL